MGAGVGAGVGAGAGAGAGVCVMSGLVLGIEGQDDEDKSGD